MDNNTKYKNIIKIALALVIAASLAFVVYQSLAPKSEQLCAVVTVGDKKAAYIVLDGKYEQREIDLKQFGVDIVLETDGERIRFKTSSCPDKICVNNGWLENDMDIAACMPNKTSVVILPRSQVPKL